MLIPLKLRKMYFDKIEDGKVTMRVGNCQPFEAVAGDTLLITDTVKVSFWSLMMAWLLGLETVNTLPNTTVDSLVDERQ